MTEELLGSLLPRLQRELGVNPLSDEQRTSLEDGLRDAESEVCLYLNSSKVPCHMLHVVVKIAAINCRSVNGGKLPAGVKASSYTEGDVSQSVTMLTAAEVQAEKDALLRTLAPYRRRARC